MNTDPTKKDICELLFTKGLKPKAVHDRHPDWSLGMIQKYAEQWRASQGIGIDPDEWDRTVKYIRKRLKHDILLVPKTPARLRNSTETYEESIARQWNAARRAVYHGLRKAGEPKPPVIGTAAGIRFTGKERKFWRN